MMTTISITLHNKYIYICVSTQFTSTTTSTQTYQIPLEKGRHSLSWMFTKDAAFTGGKDMAWIRRLVVYGAEETTKTCVACPRMTSTKGVGSDACEPCAADEIWEANTASSAIASGLCSSCPENYHPNEERSACVQSPECGADDMMTVYASCDAEGKRMKSFVWKDKLSCRVTTSLPVGSLEDCPRCPEGYVFGKVNNTATSCNACPAGWFKPAMSETDECQLCEAGKFALPSFRFDRFDRMGLDDPLLTEQFSFFCGISSDNMPVPCSTNPISFDGDGALVIDATVSPQVFLDFHLRMVADLQSDDAYLKLIFHNRMHKMDIYIDGTYTRARTSYENGLYGYKVSLYGKREVDVRLKWLFGSATSENTDVRLQAIEARGDRDGGAGSCEPIPPGSVACAPSTGDDDDDDIDDDDDDDDDQKDGNGEDEQSSAGAIYYTGCEPGFYGNPNAIACLPCAPNTFSDSSGSTACTPCPSGTSSLAASSTCVVGNLERGNMTEVFCSYYDTASTDLYNLATLSSANNETGVFGPIYESGSSGIAFYLGICKEMNSTVCTDYGGDIINTAACKVSAYTSYRTNNKVGSAIGSSIAVYPLSDTDSPMSSQNATGSGMSAIKGLKMSISGGSCGFGVSAVSHVSNITFLCDLDVGAGWPTAWDAYTAYSLSIGAIPSRALSLTSQHLPISDSTKCNHEFLWYSKFACPVCTAADVEPVEVAGCPRRVLRTYRLKASSTCFDMNNVVPKDDRCMPCEKKDYDRIEYKGCPDGKLARYVLKSPVQCYVANDAPADEMCRVCTRDDYNREEFEAGSCPGGFAAKWTPKLPKACRDIPNKEKGTPPIDEKCVPCTDAHYEARPEACFDVFGKSNITYAWITPKTCSELSGVRLPPPVVAGPCTFASSSGTNVFREPRVIASLSVGGIIIVVLICMVIRGYYKNRKLYESYAKLVDDGGIANLEMVDDSTPANEHDLEDDEMPMF